MKLWEEIELAQHRIQRAILRTPLIYSDTISKLTGLIAHHHANILHIIHERAAKEIPIGFSKVILVLETRSPDHIREIKKGLKEEGYSIETLS